MRERGLACERLFKHLGGGVTCAKAWLDDGPEVWDPVLRETAGEGAKTDNAKEGKGGNSGGRGAVPKEGALTLRLPRPPARFWGRGEK